MKLKNQTLCLEAERFIREELKAYQTTGLAVRLKHSRDRSAVVSGYFRQRDCLITAAVNPAVRLPALLRFKVGSNGSHIGQFLWRYDEEPANDLDELMVWIFFHEFHHFLCHSRQASGRWETRAHAFGFEMLRKFKAGRSAPSPEPAPLAGAAVALREQAPA